MCGRYTLTRRQQEVAERFGVQQLTVEFEPRFNIAPTQSLPVVVNTDGSGPTIQLMRWGLVPFWARDPKSMKPLINARAETISQKPVFKNNLVRRRCIVPADGFYEWKREGKTKIPMFIHSPQSGLLGFAGIWDRWTDKETNSTIQSYSIITTAANKTVSPIHDRMPVILRPEDEVRWLNPETIDVSELMKFLRPADDELITMHEVSPKVNTWSVESPDLIVAIGAC